VGKLRKFGKNRYQLGVNSDYRLYLYCELGAMMANVVFLGGTRKKLGEI